MQADEATYNKISKIIGIASLVALVVFASAVYIYQRESADGGDFELTYNSQPWKFTEHAKDVNILYIGYAKCPDVCPMTMSYVSQAFRKLKREELAQVTFSFLSVDRDHDDPKDVATYASQFNPSFVGLSGSRAQIDAVSKLYHAMYLIEEDPKSRLGYSISHADRIYFLDSRGKVLSKIQNPRSADEIATTVKELL